MRSRYRVEQLGGGESGWLLVGATTDTELTVTGLTNGTTPTFRVVAPTVPTMSSASDQTATAAWPVRRRRRSAWRCHPPGRRASTVQALSGQRSAGVATLSWRPPSSDGGSPLTGYRVDQGTSADGPWTEVATLAADVPLMVTADGTVDAQLWFRVVAINSAGDGAATSIHADVASADAGDRRRARRGQRDRHVRDATANGTSPDISYHVEARHPMSTARTRGSARPTITSSPTAG